jgi:hypothetical protein
MIFILNENAEKRPSRKGDSRANAQEHADFTRKGAIDNHYHSHHIEGGH